MELTRHPARQMVTDDPADRHFTSVDTLVGPIGLIRGGSVYRPGTTPVPVWYAGPARPWAGTGPDWPGRPPAVDSRLWRLAPGRDRAVQPAGRADRARPEASGRSPRRAGAGADGRPGGDGIRELDHPHTRHGDARRRRGGDDRPCPQPRDGGQRDLGRHGPPGRASVRAEVVMRILFLAAALALLALVLVYVYRMASGPTVFDRLLGVNGFGTKTCVVLLLTGAVFDRVDMFVDIALGYALLSFIGSLAAARYFERTGEHR